MCCGSPRVSTRCFCQREEYLRVFFFFQAEDGIRDYKVTGVQTCALPISPTRPNTALRAADGTRGSHSAARGGAARLRAPSPPAHSLGGPSCRRGLARDFGVDRKSVV